MNICLFYAAFCFLLVFLFCLFFLLRKATSFYKVQILDDSNNFFYLKLICFSAMTSVEIVYEDYSTFTVDY